VFVGVSGALKPAVDLAVSEGVATRFCSRLFDLDSTLWGADARDEASVRLGWVEDPLLQLPLVDSVEDLRGALVAVGMERVILCAMGGSSLAPEVLARASGVTLTILDTVHPDVLNPLVASDLSDAVIIVSSKSGGTVETDSLRRIFHAELTAQGLEPGERMIVITDPGSPLDNDARDAGLRVFHGNPHVGGRFSALTAFGLVPACLAGVPVRDLLESAHEAWTILSHDDPRNQGLILGASLAVGAPERNKVLLGESPPVPGFGNWIEQLVAESTGKNGSGILPVVGSSHMSLADCVTVGPGPGSDVTVEAPLGQLFLLWEVATVFAASILGVNPFDQPNVESAKVAARELLDSEPTSRAAERALGPMNVWSSPTLPAEITGLAEAVHWLLSQVTSASYIGLCVFGPGGSDEGPWREVAQAIERRTQRPVTLGFGPRFLHSTGQFHKGGPPEGVFIQLILTPKSDRAIPGRSFGATDLLLAQAHGDAGVISERAQPVLSLTTSSSNIRSLCEALGSKG